MMASRGSGSGISTMDVFGLPFTGREGIRFLYDLLLNIFLGVSGLLGGIHESSVSR